MTPDGVTLRDLVDVELRAMRTSIDDLARIVADGAKQGSEEYAQVRAAIQGLQRQLDTGVPSSEAFGQFKQHVYDRFERVEARIDLVEDDADQRRAVERWKRWFFGAAGAAFGLLLTAADLLAQHHP